MTKHHGRRAAHSAHIRGHDRRPDGVGPAVDALPFGEGDCLHLSPPAEVGIRIGSQCRHAIDHALAEPLSTSPLRHGDTDPFGRHVAAGSGSVVAGRNKESCLADETAAQNTLKQNWPKYLAADKSDCVTLENSGGPASYVELLSCLEVMRDARTIRNEDPLESDLGPPADPNSPACTAASVRVGGPATPNRSGEQPGAGGESSTARSQERKYVAQGALTRRVGDLRRVGRTAGVRL
jgi:hypothetical protein